MKFYILIIFEKSHWNFSLSIGKLSPYEIYLETG